MSDKNRDRIIKQQDSINSKKIKLNGSENIIQSEDTQFDQKIYYNLSNNHIKDFNLIAFYKLFCGINRNLADFEKTIKNYSIHYRNTDGKRKNILEVMNNNKKVNMINSILTQRSVKKFNLFNLKDLRYSDIQLLNTLWSNTFSGFCETSKNLNDYICNIELIGAKIEVVRSNICGIVQLSGIIVNETLNTLEILSPSNIITKLIKIQCILKVLVNEDKSLIISGKKLINRKLAGLLPSKQARRHDNLKQLRGINPKLFI